jgi:ubiquinone/menaquinone biosynthesis C-methylase UbiE
VLMKRRRYKPEDCENEASSDLILLYRRRAKLYDRSSLFLYLAGFRHWSYRKEAIHSIGLRPGDTIVDLGCGTGLNFSILQQGIGPQGKIVGVDITDAMLEVAKARVAAHGWSNVELVKCDVAEYLFPSPLDGILSTFALTLAPEYDEVVKDGALALRPGGRFVVLDFKRPSGWLMNKAAPLLSLLLTGPFGGTIEMASRTPWKSLEKYLALVQFTNLYFGGAYIVTGEKAALPAIGKVIGDTKDRHRKVSQHIFPSHL